MPAGRRLKVVADAGNGMAGHTVPSVFATLDVELTPMYFELDGTFPNHDANPLDHSTLVDLQAKVRQTGADIGLAFDGDADRCFVVDETGEVVSPSAITALIAHRALITTPGATILHNVITSKAVPEIIVENGGTAVRTPVGHSLIKAEMARTGAVFGGEHSGHFYFKDFFLADSGMIAALHVMAALAETDGTVSELMAQYERYVSSGEINSTVDGRPGDPGRARRDVHRSPAGHDGRPHDHRGHLVVQRPRLEHRAAAAAQRRGRRRGDHGAGTR